MEVLLGADLSCEMDGGLSESRIHYFKSMPTSLAYFPGKPLL